MTYNTAVPEREKTEPDSLPENVDHDNNDLEEVLKTGETGCEA